MYKLSLLSVLILVGCVSLNNQTQDPSAQFKAQEYVDQGTIFLQLNKLNEAKAAFEVAYDLAQIPSALDGLGCVAFMLSDKQAAEALFLKAIEIDENYGEAYGNLALLYESQGYKSKAYSIYKLALRKLPLNYRTRNNYATFLAVNKLSSKEQVTYELEKAKSISNHPFVEQNQKSVNMEIKYENR